LKEYIGAGGAPRCRIGLGLGQSAERAAPRAQALGDGEASLEAKLQTACALEAEAEGLPSDMRRDVAKLQAREAGRCVPRVPACRKLPIPH